MQRNAYKKAIGERIQQLRKGLRKEGFNGQPKTVNEFLEFLNPKIDDDYDNYGDYSLTDIEFSYKKDYVSKVEHGIVFPSTDFLFLIHLRFNVSLDYLVFGHNLPEIEELRKICKHSGKSKITDFCFNLLEDNSKYAEDFDDEDIEKEIFRFSGVGFEADASDIIKTFDKFAESIREEKKKKIVFDFKKKFIPNSTIGETFESELYTLKNLK